MPMLFLLSSCTQLDAQSPEKPATTDQAHETIGWCASEKMTVGFGLENGKTVSICRSTYSSDQLYFYGVLGEEPEFLYRGPLLQTIDGVSGYSPGHLSLTEHDLPKCIETGDPRLSTVVSSDALLAAALAPDSGGFFLAHGSG